MNPSFTFFLHSRNVHISRSRHNSLISQTVPQGNDDMVGGNTVARAVMAGMQRETEREQEERSLPGIQWQSRMPAPGYRREGCMEGRGVPQGRRGGPGHWAHRCFSSAFPLVVPNHSLTSAVVASMHSCW